MKMPRLTAETKSLPDRVSLLAGPDMDSEHRIQPSEKQVRIFFLANRQKDLKNANIPIEIHWLVRQPRKEVG